jgi:hypothetical protein
MTKDEAKAIFLDRAANYPPECRYSWYDKTAATARIKHLPDDCDIIFRSFANVEYRNGFIACGCPATALGAALQVNPCKILHEMWAMDRKTSLMARLMTRVGSREREEFVELASTNFDRIYEAVTR